MQPQTRRDRTLLGAGIEVMPHSHARDVVFGEDEPALRAVGPPQALELEDLPQRRRERGPDHARAEARVQAVAEEERGFPPGRRTVRVDLLGRREGEGVHGRFGGGDEDGLAFGDADGAAPTPNNIEPITLIDISTATPI